MSKLKKPTVQELVSKISCFNNLNNLNYDISYIEFINYFQQIQIINRHNFIIGINFSYGWMPTIFNIKNDNFDKCIDILNECRSNVYDITKDNLSSLKSLINNSVVGTTKLLHFINPEKYPIIDSRVCKFLTGRKSINITEDLYLEYLDICKNIINDQSYNNSIHSKYLINSINQNATKMRSLEQLMYLSSNNPL